MLRTVFLSPHRSPGTDLIFSKGSGHVNGKNIISSSSLSVTETSPKHDIQSPKPVPTNLSKRGTNVYLKDIPAKFIGQFGTSFRFPIAAVKTEKDSNLMDVQERHITNRKCQNSGVHGQFHRSSLLWEMTVGVGGVCSLISEVLVNLNKGMPLPACFDWTG
ncbi:hypothetical protein J6590_097854 [Homalodisca vitripennis]|nr:hypothetical protein J6590_097854 [Homalodisca vitripennis]